MDVANREWGVRSLELIELDPRIRQEPADHTATRPHRAQQVRDAQDWWQFLRARDS